MPDSKSKKILIVEDERAYSRALVLKLQNAGFEAEAVGNGEEALEVLHKAHYDLVLADLVMPKMNGFELLEAMKKEGISTSVIGLSNLSQSDDETKMRAAGAVDFLSKSNTPIIGVIKRVEHFFNKT